MGNIQESSFEIANTKLCKHLRKRICIFYFNEKKKNSVLSSKSESETYDKSASQHICRCISRNVNIYLFVFKRSFYIFSSSVFV